MKLLQQELIANPRYIQSFEDVTIYGVAGTNGSGKDTIMHLLAEAGFLVYNTSDDLRQISHAVFASTHRGGNDAPMGRVGNAERATYPGGPVDLGLIDWWARVAHLPAELQPKGLVIGSLRAVGETTQLKKFGGKLIVIDADPKVRYARLIARSRHHEKDISYEQFLGEEAGDMAHGSTDPTKFGMAEVIKMADIRLINNSDDIVQFKKEAKKTLGLTENANRNSNAKH